MKYLFLLWLIPACMFAEVYSNSNLQDPMAQEPLISASLIPLEPEFPIFVSQANRELWMVGKLPVGREKQKIRSYLDAHTFPWLTIAFLLGSGAIGWVLFLTRENWFSRKEKRENIPSPREQMEHAFKQLDKVEFSTKNEQQNYYAALEKVLLKALSHYFGWKKSMTTSEVQKEMQGAEKMAEIDKDKVVAFLTEIDRIKFANWQPSSERYREMFQEIRTFIYEMPENTHQTLEKNNSSDTRNEINN